MELQLQQWNGMFSVTLGVSRRAQPASDRGGLFVVCKPRPPPGRPFSLEKWMTDRKSAAEILYDADHACTRSIPQPAGHTVRVMSYWAPKSRL